MPSIHTLSPEIIAKIAAGEVIERPAYALKELIDNAIDAGADYITIFLEEGGLKKIMVTDNGEGMSSEDVGMCFKLHTTSKIDDDSPLIGIRTLGFRGEALASIASVSTMTIKSRSKDSDSGTQAVIKAGRIQEILPVGSPVGTTILAENLFSSVPARKKFLTRESTEMRHCQETITHFALSYPHIRFFLKHNNKILLDLPKQDLQSRITQILGETLSSHLVPITCDDSYLSLRGFIAKPQMAIHSTSKQFLFVNNRAVTDKTISLAVKEAFGTMLEKEAHVPFVFFLSIPYEAVDVNVHPRKEQVLFTDTRMVFDTIYQAVKDTLEKYTIAFQNLNWVSPTVTKTTTTFAGKLLKQNVTPVEEKYDFVPKEAIQIHNLYIAMPTPQGMIILDQHAAHERIQYEKFKKAFEHAEEKSISAPLLTSYGFDVSLSEKLLLEEHANKLSSLGFSIEHLHSNKFLLTHVPMLYKDRDLSQLVKDLLEQLENTHKKSFDTITERMLAFLACRSAVMQGDKLTIQQMVDIAKTLTQTPNNATCPHARPTYIEIPLSQLNTLFKR